MPNSQNNVPIDYEQPYITRDEYLQAKGVDLEVEIQTNDNPSAKVETFVKDLTHFVMDYLVHQYQCNDLNRTLHDFSELKEFRRKRFHYGMIEQIEYVLNNGLIHQDSGINSSTGMVIDYSNLILSKSAFNQFRLGAFCNIKTEGPVIYYEDDDYEA